MSRSAMASHGWRIERVPELDGFAVEWLEPGRAILSRRGTLYEAADLVGARPRRLARIPAAPWRRAAARVRPLQRLLRHMVYNVLPLGDGSLFVTFDRQVFRCAGGRVEPIAGFARPCRVLRGGCARDASGDVYFGEYFGNGAREAVRVYRYRPGAGRLEVAHTFAPGEIRHVHGVYHDAHTGELWLAAGDRAGECRIVATADGFRTLRTVGQGDETWRAVSLLFTRDAVYYGMDAEFQTNRVFRIDRATGERTPLGEIDGPVYYAHGREDLLLFAVTAELCPSQVGRRASLWEVVEGRRLRRVHGFEKDRLPVAAFMPGTIHFARGPGRGRREVVFSCVGLRGADDRTFIATPPAGGDADTSRTP